MSSKRLSAKAEKNAAGPAAARRGSHAEAPEDESATNQTADYDISQSDSAQEPTQEAMIDNAAAAPVPLRQSAREKKQAAKFLSPDTNAAKRATANANSNNDEDSPNSREREVNPRESAKDKKKNNKRDKPKRVLANSSDDDFTGVAFSDSGQELFCICRTPYDSRRFMVGCDSCDNWFHARCAGITQSEAELIENWTCPPCRKRNGEKINLQLLNEQADIAEGLQASRKAKQASMGAEDDKKRDLKRNRDEKDDKDGKSAKRGAAAANDRKSGKLKAGKEERREKGASSGVNISPPPNAEKNRSRRAASSMLGSKYSFGSRSHALAAAQGHPPLKIVLEVEGEGSDVEERVIRRSDGADVLNFLVGEDYRSESDEDEEEIYFSSDDDSGMEDELDLKPDFLELVRQRAEVAGSSVEAKTEDVDSQAMRKRSLILDYQLASDLNDDFGQSLVLQARFDSISSDDLDHLLLRHLEGKRKEVECALLDLEGKRRIYLAGIDHAARLTIAQTMEQHNPQAEDSVLFEDADMIVPPEYEKEVEANIAAGFASPRGLTSPRHLGQTLAHSSHSHPSWSIGNNANGSLHPPNTPRTPSLKRQNSLGVFGFDRPEKARVHAELLVCAGCDGHIPVADFASHLVNCAIQGPEADQKEWACDVLLTLTGQYQSKTSEFERGNPPPPGLVPLPPRLNFPAAEPPTKRPCDARSSAITAHAPPGPHTPLKVHGNSKFQPQKSSNKKYFKHDYHHLGLTSVSGRFGLQLAYVESVCGYPIIIDDRRVVFCQQKKRSCIDHLLWEDLMKSEIEQQYLSYTRRLELIKSELDFVHVRLNDRALQLQYSIEHTMITTSQNELTRTQQIDRYRALIEALDAEQAEVQRYFAEYDMQTERLREEAKLVKQLRVEQEEREKVVAMSDEEREQYFKAKSAEIEEKRLLEAQRASEEQQRLAAEAQQQQQIAAAKAEAQPVVIDIAAPVQAPLAVPFQPPSSIAAAAAASVVSSPSRVFQAVALAAPIAPVATVASPSGLPSIAFHSIPGPNVAAAAAAAQHALAAAAHPHAHALQAVSSPALLPHPALHSPVGVGVSVPVSVNVSVGVPIASIAAIPAAPPNAFGLPAPPPPAFFSSPM